MNRGNIKVLPLSGCLFPMGSKLLSGRGVLTFLNMLRKIICIGAPVLVMRVLFALTVARKGSFFR